MGEILDSGERKEFPSGAVRDIQEGKGRCDLLPLNVVGDLFESDDRIRNIFQKVQDYLIFKDVSSLDKALSLFSSIEYENDLPGMILDVSKHFEEGAIKYGERNWEKGIPMHCYIDSAIRHLLKYTRGDKDEPHGRAFVWNILCLIWTRLNQPHMDDLPIYRKEEQPETTEISEE